jgi:hypothetical protein
MVVVYGYVPTTTPHTTTTVRRVPGRTAEGEANQRDDH